MSTSTSSPNGTTEPKFWFAEKGWFTNTLAFMVVLLSAAILIILICMASRHLTPTSETDTSFDNVKELLSLLLPVIGTWMGTLLAFYFSKENFEAAKQQVSELVKTIQSPEQATKAPAVADVMLKPSDSSLLVTKDKATFRGLLLDTLLTKMTETHSERMPILEEGTLKFIYLIYRTTIERYVSELQKGTVAPPLSQAGANPINTALLTVEDMLTSDLPLIKEIEKINQKGFFLPVSATIEQVRKLMSDEPICQDVFFTKNGTMEEPVEGWITNNLLLEKLNQTKPKNQP